MTKMTAEMLLEEIQDNALDDEPVVLEILTDNGLIEVPLNHIKVEWRKKSQCPTCHHEPKPHQTLILRGDL